MSKKEIIDITPDPDLLDGIAASGRNISENLMDLIDNSLDAMYRDSDGEQLYTKQNIDIRWHKIGKIPEKGYKKYENKEGWLISDKGSGIETPEDIFILVPISVPAKSTTISSGIFSAGHLNSTFLLTIFKTPPLFKPGESG